MCENCINYKYLIAIIIIYNVVYRTLQPSKENTPIVEEPFQEQRPPVKRVILRNGWKCENQCSIYLKGIVLYCSYS